jgi:hypothetical protein
MIATRQVTSVDVFFVLYARQIGQKMTANKAVANTIKRLDIKLTLFEIEFTIRDCGRKRGI